MTILPLLEIYRIRKSCSLNVSPVQHQWHSLPQRGIMKKLVASANDFSSSKFSNLNLEVHE